MATSASADARVINGSRCDCESCLGNVLDGGVIGLFAGGQGAPGRPALFAGRARAGTGALQCRAAAQVGGGSAVAS